MQKGNYFLYIFIVFLFTGCAVGKNYNPSKKFTKAELQQDYTLLRNILESKHPALYWYTPKDSMNYYFDSLYNKIADSMTEIQFGWKVLAPLTNKIHCGHTSFGMSKNWYHFIRNKQIPSFPLYVKLWGDTIVVTGNLNNKDTVFKRGTLLTSVNGIKNHQLIQQMFEFLPLDGYADNVNYIRLSSNFPYYHRNIFGIYKNYRVGYVDSTGAAKVALLPMSNPEADSTKKGTKKRQLKPKEKDRHKRKKELKESYRSLQIDSSLQTATLVLNTFSNGEGRHLRPFIKRTFRKIRKQHIKNLIIDLRSNGGGEVNIYVLLAKYLRKTKFKVADSSYAVTKNLTPYSGYIKQGFFNNLGLFFLTKKHSDGNYHFGYWERHFYYPKKKNHFDGKVYVLINGPTFSASTLFCNAVKGQENVKLVGEETGGGEYGNSGIMIPDITLPITKLTVRLPLFKIVQFNHAPKNGRGISPDIYLPPTVEGVRRNIDRKMEFLNQLIKNEGK